MPTVQDFCQFLEAVAPAELAEQWDNVGLLVGDRGWDVRQVMTCLTITPETVEEAVSEGANLIVTHHPLPFRPLGRITGDTVAGAMLLRLIGRKVAVYSPHTSFDSAVAGINQHLAEGLELVDICPLQPCEAGPRGTGSGRWGNLQETTTLEKLAATVKKFLQIQQLRCVGTSGQAVSRVAVACGSAGEMLHRALETGCDAMLVGEMSFHACLEARARRLAVLLAGHYATERFAVEELANVLQAEYPPVKVWASYEESDPFVWV